MGDIEDYLDDMTVQRSCSFSLLQIGQYVKRITVQTKSKYPDMDWSVIAGLRDRIAHNYVRVNQYALWDVITNDIPKLRESLMAIKEDMVSTP